MKGRPTSYSEEIAERICFEISIKTVSLKTICQANNDMPCVATVYSWLNTYKDFLDKYTRAREAQADLMAEEILSIADDSTNDTIEGPYGEMENKEWVNRSKLRIEARKWLASKLLPKKYGDRIDHTTGGDKMPTPIINIMPPKQDDVIFISNNEE